jgi:hypothetical protein
MRYEPASCNAYVFKRLFFDNLIRAESVSFKFLLFFVPYEHPIALFEICNFDFLNSSFLSLFDANK